MRADVESVLGNPFPVEYGGSGDAACGGAYGDMLRRLDRHVAGGAGGAKPSVAAEMATTGWGGGAGGAARHGGNGGARGRIRRGYETSESDVLRRAAMLELADELAGGADVTLEVAGAEHMCPAQVLAAWLGRRARLLTAEGGGAAQWETKQRAREEASGWPDVWTELERRAGGTPERFEALQRATATSPWRWRWLAPRATRRKPLALAHSDPRGWRRVPGLGPFALEPINFGAIHFQKEGCRYSLNLTGELVGHLHGKGLASRGYLTPAQPLLMEPHDRRLANIPLEATHFAWAFPLSGVADVADRDALTPKTREGAFALFGGFVYLSANSMVIAVNALAKARRGLCFDGPFPLLPDASKGGDQLDVLAAAPAAAAPAPLKDGAALRSVLLKEARANHATIGDLLSIGVRNFAWLGPGESRGAENGSAWPHGAFIYLYDESRADLDCYFTLKESVRNDLSRTMGSPMRSMAAYATSNRLDMGLGTSNTSVEALGLGRSRQISMPMEKGRSISSGDLKARGA